jgi:hypothetical protein
MAEDIPMIVSAITSVEADRAAGLLLSGEQPELNTFEVGSSGREEWEAAEAGIRDWVDNDATAYLERTDHQAKFEFDAFAAESLHRLLQIPAYVAASREFWRYVNVGLLWEFVSWRHFDAKEDTVAKVNYGNGKRRYCLASRLWFRGEVGCDMDREDRYELVRRGGTDFWSSGLTRVQYPGARPIARAVVELRYPENGEFRGSKYTPQTMDTDAARELYKRLKRYDATIGLVTLSNDEAKEFVKEVAADLLS